METTYEEKKTKAVEFLNTLDIYAPYINGFKTKQNKVCFFEGYAGFWAWQDEKLTQKVKEIEKKYNCCVYAITHDYTEFGECYSFLIVTDYKTEWSGLLENLGAQKFRAFAYVWNADDDTYSEFGDIAVQSFGGGIKRIA